MPNRTRTTQELADLLSVSVSAVNSWVRQGCPCDKSKSRREPNRFDEGEVAAWLQAQGRDGRVGRPAEPTSDELKALRIRKEAALVARYERENKVAMGQLIDAQAEQARDISKINAVRSRLCGLGATLSPQLEGKDGIERQTIIETAVESILTEFAK